MRIRSFMILFYIYISFLSFAQVEADKMDEIVITAQYAPQSEKNAVYKVKVIKEETIKAKAANNLRELLLQEITP